jgi:isocitrate dehydrogenase kinase/phosphatase
MSMPIARYFARAILYGFDGMFADWQNMTLGALARSKRAEWHAIHQAMRDRLTVYRGKVLGTAGILTTIAGKRLHDRSLWREAKHEYALIVTTHSNAEIAQTFFNSCYCYVFGHQKVSGLNAFALDQQTPTQASETSVVNQPASSITIATTVRCRN